MSIFVRMKEPLFYLSLLGVLVWGACSGGESDVPTLDIAGALERGEIPLPENILRPDKSLTIPLLDSLFVGASNIAGVKDGKMIVYDAERILVLDLDAGCPMYGINRKGNGPEEYLDIGDLSIDWEAEEILVFDLHRKRVQVYSLEGTYRRTIPAPDRSCCGVYVAANTLFWPTSAGEKSIPSAYYTDKEGHLKDSSSTRNVEIRSTFMSLFNSIGGGDDGSVIMRKACSDTLFRMTPGKEEEPALVAHSGEKGMSAASWENFQTYRRDAAKCINPDKQLWSRSFFFYNYFYKNKAYFDIWDIRSKKLLGRKIATGPDDLTGFFWPSYSSDEGLLYALEEDADGLQIFVF